jgi:glycerol-3-phosphate dehydrogenase
VNITHVGIIGAGQMGSGIAQVCAAAGLTVTLVDVSDVALERGLASIAAGLDRLVKKGTLSADDKSAAQARIRVRVDYEGLKDVDLVVEAATATHSRRIERRRASDNGIIQSRHSRRIVPMTRSQIAFAFGLANGESNTSRPNARIDSSRCLAKMLSRSWI